MRTCKHCSLPIPNSRSRAARYCSTACKDAWNNVPDRRKSSLTCSECGKTMWGGSTSAPQGVATCRDCRAVRHGTKQQWRNGCRCEACVGAYRRGAGPCAVPECDGGSVARKLCITHYSQLLRGGVNPVRPACVVCGEPMSRRSDAANPMHRSCKDGIPNRPKVRDLILQRDEGVCGICLTPVDVKAHYLDPASPTLDHIVPRAHGGDHSLGNLRLAHRQCNLRRGADRMTDEQVRDIVKGSRESIAN